MTPLQISLLKAEIEGDPLSVGYASLLPDSPGIVVERLNAISDTMIKTRMITARAILTDCGVLGSGILDKLETVSASISSVRWALKFLGQESGIDVGSSAVQNMIDQLKLASVFTSNEADALKVMALQPCSRAEKLNIGYVTEANLRAALEM